MKHDRTQIEAAHVFERVPLCRQTQHLCQLVSIRNVCSPFMPVCPVNCLQCVYKHCWPVTHPLPAAMLYREPKVKKRPLMELQCENRLGLASRERSLWSCGFLLFGYYNKQLVRPVWIFSNKIPSHLVLSLCKQSVQHSETAAYLQLKVW